MRDRKLTRRVEINETSTLFMDLKANNRIPQVQRFQSGPNFQQRQRSLQAATASFLDHFHSERNHQGIGNQLIIPGNEVGRTVGEIACLERLGGMLRYYYRKAA